MVTKPIPLAFSIHFAMDPQYRAVMNKLITATASATEVIGAIRRTDFDSDVVFGSATAAYQFEGAAKDGGKGPSVWDSWTHTQPDKIADGSNGDVAVNQYNLFKEDVQLMKKTGLEAYRFSISWPRILPGGKLDAGINKQGIKYYNTLIDELLAAGIQPYVTLFHWDLPLALELEYGGFMSDNIVGDFVDYAELCFWEFGDRVKNWITFNEGWTYTTSGYVRGSFPPGRGVDEHPDDAKYNHVGHKGAGAARHCTNGDAGTEPYIVAHNMILAHAYAVQMYRTNFLENQGGKIGITNNCHFFEPLNDTVEDRNACIRALDWMLGWFAAPIATGEYPPNMRKAAGDRLPVFTDEEKKVVKGSYDFMGLNYYTTWYATNTPKVAGEKDTYLSDQEANIAPSKDGVAIGEASGAAWLYIVPRGIYNLLVFAKETYKIDLFYITENGVAEKLDATLPLSQAREDPMRVRYYSQHLWYLKKAISAGINVKAYFIWSFGDNFEWADGYTYRFGTFYVDYTSGELTRYPKTSAIWWRNFFSKSINAPAKREAKDTGTTATTGNDSRKRTRVNIHI